MQSKMDWTKWADFIQRYKLDGLVAWILDAGAPFRVLGAQVIYIFQPFLGLKHSKELAQMLETNEESQALVRVLLGEKKP